MIGPASKQPTVRLLASLLPPAWPTRAAALSAAARLDEQQGGDGFAALDAYDRWRRLGELPPAGPLLDVVAELAHVLGGVAHELRRRPRAAETRDQSTTTHQNGWRPTRRL